MAFNNFPYADFQDLNLDWIIRKIHELEEKIKSIVVQASGVESVNGKTGVVVLTYSDVGAMSASTPIPTVPSNVSAFTNDANYQNATQVQNAINDALAQLPFAEGEGF